MKNMKTRAIPLFVLAVAATSAHATIVYSNALGPIGDVFVDLTSTTAVGASNWQYNNMRNDSINGIQTVIPRSGNGSATFTTTSATGKGDIEFFGLEARGTLGNLSTLKYDWFRDSSSTTVQHYHPVVRLFVDADGSANTTSDRGLLIFERAYNQGTGAVPTGAWVSEDVVASNYNLWQRKFSPGTSYDTAGNWQSLTTWQSPTGFTPTSGGLTFNANSMILGANMGVGSGWNNSFIGAVDNFEIGFVGGSTYSANFEVTADPVPEPFTLALGAAGLIGAARRRRNRR